MKPCSDRKRNTQRRLAWSIASINVDKLTNEKADTITRVSSVSNEGNFGFHYFAT
jgi:hypothetical protein